MEGLDGKERQRTTDGAELQGWEVKLISLAKRRNWRRKVSQAEVEELT